MFMTAAEPRLTNTPEKRPSTTLQTLRLETWPTVGESQMSLAQKGEGIVTSERKRRENREEDCTD